jgi:hypothetical protein
MPKKKEEAEPEVIVNRAGVGSLVAGWLKRHGHVEPEVAELDAFVQEARQPRCRCLFLLCLVFSLIFPLSFLAPPYFLLIS